MGSVLLIVYLLAFPIIFRLPDGMDMGHDSLRLVNIAKVAIYIYP